MKNLRLVALTCLLLVMFITHGFAAGQEVDRKSIKVTASAAESKAKGGFGDFPAEATLDGSLKPASSWRADGKGQWIQYDLGAAKHLDEIQIAFVSGDSRKYTIDIQVSKTGEDKDWRTIVEKVESSGKTADFEPFKLNGVETRFVRIVGQGNNSAKFPTWINITEVKIIEAGAATQATTQGAGAKWAAARGRATRSAVSPKAFHVC